MHHVNQPDLLVIRFAYCTVCLRHTGNSHISCFVLHDIQSLDQPVSVLYKAHVRPDAMDTEYNIVLQNTLHWTSCTFSLSRTLQWFLNPCCEVAQG